jgi:hypothetical protein
MEDNDEDGMSGDEDEEVDGNDEWDDDAESMEDDDEDGDDEVEDADSEWDDATEGMESDADDNMNGDGDEADFDNDGVDIDEEAEQAKRQQEFEDVCEVVRRHDPEKMTVFVRRGHDNGIRNALATPNVRSIYVSLFPEDVSSPDDTNWGLENLSPLLQYIREAPAFQTSAFQTLHIWGGSLTYILACIQAFSQHDNGSETPWLATPNVFDIR